MSDPALVLDCGVKLQLATRYVLSSEAASNAISPADARQVPSITPITWSSLLISRSSYAALSYRYSYALRMFPFLITAPHSLYCSRTNCPKACPLNGSAIAPRLAKRERTSASC